jgi:Gluconate 2-dehydrogenase subunit 3
MDKKDPVIRLMEDAKAEQEGRSGISRREMVRRIATAMTAGSALAAIPGSASAHPIYKHMASGAATEQADSKASEDAWTPAFFDPHQNETFAVLAERIVPGSTEAQVGQFVDLLLSVDTQENQKQFLNSLSAFEAYSLKAYQRPFKELSEKQQNQVLTVASTAKPGAELRRHRRHVLGPQPAITGEESILTLRDHFENLKHWVSGAYLSSEPGMKYLGWTGQVYFSSFPGCQESGSRT